MSDDTKYGRDEPVQVVVRDGKGNLTTVGLGWWQRQLSHPQAAPAARPRPKKTSK